MAEKSSRKTKSQLSQSDKAKSEFMLKKLELESARQASTRNLAEQVLNWYVAVLVFVGSGVGLFWGSVSQNPDSLLILALVATGLGVLGVMITMRILRFMIDYDLQQKVIDAIELYFVEDDPSLRLHLLKSTDWPVGYRALNPWNTIYYLAFSLFNATVTSSGIGLLGYYITEKVAVACHQVVSGNGIIWTVCAILLAISAFVFLQIVRKRSVKKVEVAYADELNRLKTNTPAISGKVNLEKEEC